MTLSDLIRTGIEEVITALTRNQLMDGEHLSAECRINKGFLEKFNIAIFAVPSKSSLIFTSFFKLLKYIRTGIEVVITGLTRNVVKLEEVPTATNPDFTGLF